MVEIWNYANEKGLVYDNEAAKEDKYYANPIVEGIKYNVVNEAVNVYEENKDKLQSGNKTTTDVIENGGDFEDINRSEQVELFLIEGINTLTEGLDYTEDYEANYIMKHSRNAYIAIKSQNACDAIVAALDEVNPLDITYQEVDAFVYPFMEEEIRNNINQRGLNHYASQLRIQP